MKIWTVVALLAGLALAVFLITQVGIGQVLEAASRVGWGGFALICIAGLPTIACLGGAWYALLAGRGAGWPILALGRQIRDSSSDLLPFTQVGGMVIGARIAALGGVPAATAYASMMVDVTTELMGQIAFIVLGLLLGLTALRASPAMAPYADAMVICTALMVPAAAAFILLQRKGTGLAEKLAGKLLPAAVHHTAAFSQALHGFYENPLRLAISATLHLTGWIVSGLWIWLIFRLLGADIDVFSAIVIEALLGALRSATVFIPSAIGVQEAGYAALAPVFGIGPEIGLAVSLLKRGRDVAVGIPALLVWQAIEGRRVLVRGKAKEL
jgi:glycosyltransferase 2 family protein